MGKESIGGPKSKIGNSVDPQGHIISVHDGSGTLLRSELY
jgi:hypothetical protein